jgi:hypothetical protein
MFAVNRRAEWRLNGQLDKWAPPSGGGKAPEGGSSISFLEQITSCFYRVPAVSDWPEMAGGWLESWWQIDDASVRTTLYNNS